MDFQISDCSGLDPSRLCCATNEAFSDYVVPLSMTETQFRDFQCQRGFSARNSFVAWCGDQIAGFWFSSSPISQYGNRAYTLSVGTLPDYRRLGVSNRLLQAVSEVLRKDAAKGMQLEVVATNQNAISTYEKFRFKAGRTLGVFKVHKDALERSVSPNHQLKPIAVEDLPVDEAAFFDAMPTPQNSRAAIVRLGSKTQLLIARKNGECVGWGAIYEDGVVAQIAVHKNFRRQGIGRAILFELGQLLSVDQLTFVNVDETGNSLNAFLKHAGAEEVLRQHEMHLKF
jgi:ribosomal protein S18 acetylase RimI-like enzyme